MSKHTPGPWHTAGNQGVQIRSAKHQIAKVWCMHGNTFKYNAALIAAAPELLTVAETLVKFVDAPKHGANMRNYVDLGEALVRAARSAIVKATKAEPEKAPASDPPEALRLADIIGGNVADELRRLHATNTDLLKALTDLVDDLKLRATLAGTHVLDVSNGRWLAAERAMANARGEPYDH